MRKFSVRDLFFVVTIAAILLAWRLDHSRLRSQIVRTKVFALSYLEAGQLASSLEANASGTDGLLDITSDPRTNTVIVRGNEVMLSKVEAAIVRLDKATAP